MPERIQKPKADLVKLGALVQSARRQRAMTISDLAAKANVSNRTIIGLEAGVRRAIRYDAVVRLISAFPLPISEQREWLGLAGHINLAAADVNRILDNQAQRRAGLVESPEVEPEVYFQELRDKVRDRPALMCMWYTSPPAASVSPGLRQLVIDSLKSGLWLAMFCPYPAETPVELASLRAHYNEVICGVRELALLLRKTVGEALQSKIAVFEPVPQEQLVAPPMRLAEYRPALLHYNDVPAERDELGVYLRLGFGARDRWLRVYSPDWHEGPAKEAALKALKTWQDYFAHVLKAWDPDGVGWNREKLKDGRWKLVIG
ncbi:MAG: helix-turn-helix transcriptional regulator [Planctomycetota bacterium]|nr:helix-turn-helix transcriptional regulator [Planctomycetota bacterium]